MRAPLSTTILVLCALALFAAPREARASLVNYEFTARFTAITTNSSPGAAAALAELNALGGTVDAVAFGTFSFYTEAIPSPSDPSDFSTSRGPVASLTFGTAAGLSISYSATEPMHLRATTTQWTFDYGLGPTATNVAGFESTIFQLLSNGGSLSTGVPILQAYDPSVLDHGLIHFGGSSVYPLDIRASVSDIHQVPEPPVWMFIACAGLIMIARRYRRA